MNLGDTGSVHGANSIFWSTHIQVNQLIKVTMVQKLGITMFNALDIALINFLNKTAYATGSVDRNTLSYRRLNLPFLPFLIELIFLI